MTNHLPGLVQTILFTFRIKLLTADDSLSLAQINLPDFGYPCLRPIGLYATKSVLIIWISIFRLSAYPIMVISETRSAL
jgi:hypothetical protein